MTKSDTTQEWESWPPGLSPSQEWKLHNGESRTPMWFLRFCNRIRSSARRSALEEALSVLPSAGEDPGDFGGIDDKSIRDIWWGRKQIEIQSRTALTRLLNGV